MSAITAKASRKMKKYAVLTREPRCFLGSFDFSWEQRKLASLCEKFTDGDWIESKDQSDFGVRLVQTGNVGVAEYLDKPNNKKWISEDTFDRLHCEEVLPGDILISRLPEPAGRACIVPLLGTKMITAVDCTIVRTAPDMSNKFLVQYLSSQAYFDDVNTCLAGGTRQRISRGNLANFNVPIPVKKSEQDAIGMFFGYLDNLITLHQRKCALLFSPFQAFISMMFITSTFSWEQREVGDLLIERSQQAPMSDEYPLMAFIANEGVAPKGERYDRSALVTDTVNKLYKKTEKGDFIYSSNNLETGSIGLNKYGKACISPVYSIFEPTGIADSDFLGRRLVRKDFINAMVKWRQGVIYGQWRIHESDFLKIEISVPSVEEQRKIGAYLDQLDNLITLHQRKCIFFTGRAGRLISTVNKKRITSSWEQRKFDEVFDCTVPNNTLSRAELSYDEGTVLNVHYGDVLIKYGSVLDVQKDDIPRIPHRCREDFNGALLQDGDVIIADTAEDETTGKACEIGNLQGSAIVSGLHTMVCRPRNRMALGYLGYYLNSNAYHHQLLPLMQGIKVLSLSRSNIQKTSVSYPIAVKEQQLIAYYFSQLDNLITLHQRQPFLQSPPDISLIVQLTPPFYTFSWEQRKLGDIADIVGGGTPSTGNQSYWDGDIDWYAPAEIADQIYANSSQKKITGLGYENSSAKMLPPGTVLFTSRAGIGKTAILTRKGCTNQGFQSIVPHRGELDSYFIFSRTEELKRYGELVGAGSTFVEVSGKQMAVMELMMPPTMREQQTIGGFFQQLDHLITLHQRKPFLMKWRTSDANRNQTNRLVL